MTVELRKRDPLPEPIGNCAACVFAQYGQPEYEDGIRSTLAGGAPDVQGPDELRLMCHRFPPSHSIAYPFTHWPIVAPDDWCGEFAPAQPAGPSPAPGPDEAFPDDLIGRQ